MVGLIDYLLNYTHTQISRNQLSSFLFIPQQQQHDSQLQQIDLDGNKISQLPDTIPETMEYLRLSYNELQEISLPFACSVGDSSRLRELYLSHNRLKSVPSMIFNCATLTYFYVGMFQSIYLPQSKQMIFSGFGLQDAELFRCM